jgi:hypothetical protein
MRLRTLTLAALIAAGLPTFAAAATPSPAPRRTIPSRISIEAITPKSSYPTVPLQTSVLVDVNKLGQVTKARFEHACKSPSFNTQTFGNALQAFIRTPDGRAIPGQYRLSYSYDPKKPLRSRIHRDVALVHEGGVDANAPGAATEMMAVAHKNGLRAAQRAQAASKPAATTPPAVHLPDLPQVMTSPSH